MKPAEIQELIKFVSKSGVSEVEIQDKDFKIVIKTSASRKGKSEDIQTIYAQPQQMMMQAPQQVQQVAPAPVAPEETTIVTGQFENLVVLKCGVQDLHTTPVRERRAEVKGGKVQVIGYQQNIKVNGLVSVYFDSFTN